MWLDLPDSVTAHNSLTAYPNQCSQSQSNLGQTPVKHVAYPGQPFTIASCNLQAGIAAEGRLAREFTLTVLTDVLMPEQAAILIDRAPNAAGKI